VEEETREGKNIVAARSRENQRLGLRVWLLKRMEGSEVRLIRAGVDHAVWTLFVQLLTTSRGRRQQELSPGQVNGPKERS
jgi:hypothetical protein